MTTFSHRHFDGIKIVALNRHGGVSSGAFTSLNLAPYVGDDSSNSVRNIEIAGKTVNAKNIAYLRAEHGNTVHVVETGAGIFELPSGDGAVTRNPDIALLALSADCVAAAIVDPVHRVIGVFHAGWKGVLAQVARTTWEHMHELGAQTASSHAVLGPSICGRCYEVDAQRVDEFRIAQPECIVDGRHLDISKGIQSQLSTLGISVDVLAGCTFEDENLFSYRAAAGEPTGRGGLIVSMAGTS